MSTNDHTIDVATWPEQHAMVTVIYTFLVSIAIK